MRRTYRSKKESAGALDHRDVIQGLDEKASVFEAFYIQNIKQTKRELSCVGSSNHLPVKNKVRKRKYVKRIVKEVEPPCSSRDSTSESKSVFLTPDKSIRVNKPQDLFDQLLNSSSPKQLNSSIKHGFNIFKRQPKMEGKTYTRQKIAKIKKMNCSSSDSYDSNKENSSQNSSDTNDTTDIRKHVLVIENEKKPNQECIDESINNIFKNISIYNKISKHSCTNSPITSKLSTAFGQNHRLTTNFNSPDTNSPSCSTPFKEKYRTHSIYNFSPIVDKKDISPKYLLETEENGNNTEIIVSNESILPPDEGIPPPSPIIHLSANKSVKSEKNKASNKIECDLQSPANKKTKESTDYDIVKALSNIEISEFPSTEVEPFLGFSNVQTIGNNNKSINENSCIDLSQATDNLSLEVSLVSKKEEMCNNREKNIMKENSLGSQTNSADSSISSSQATDNTSYDTCNSDQSAINARAIDAAKVPVVEINRLSNSVLYKYIKNMRYEEDAQEESSDIDGDNYASFNNCASTTPNSNRSMISNKSVNFDENNGILEDDFDKYEIPESHLNESTCKDTNSDKMLNSVDNVKAKNTNEIPVVDIERLNDSILMKYMKKLRDVDSQGESSDIDSDDFASFMERESSAPDSNESIVQNIDDNDDQLENTFDDQSSIKSLDECTNAETNSKEMMHDEIGNVDTSLKEDSVTSNDFEINKNVDEERCISFVTTRRRNDIVNNSISLSFDSSISSTSSANCDKTVLSNNAKKSLDYKVDDEDANRYKECDIITDNKDTDNNIDADCDKPKISRVTTRKSSRLTNDSKTICRSSQCFEAIVKPRIVLPPGKKWERSLSIYRRMTMMADHFDHSILEEEELKTKGRKYRQSVINTMEMQDQKGSLHNESILSRRSTFVSKPCRSTIRIIKEPNDSRLSLSNTTISEDFKGFLTEDCDDTVVDLSKLSIADSEHEVTVLEQFHDTTSRVPTARDYVLRRCNQADAIHFDECYPDAVLKNCHKIGEGVYGEVFLWRARDGVRVMKIVPIAGTTKVNGERQKDFSEVISEIVIAMELSALRSPIDEIQHYLDEGKDIDALDLHSVENATDVFNEVLAVRCVSGSYPTRLLDLWELYDECKGSENDNPAILPPEQQYIVLELANAGQDLESYEFNNAEQAHALFLQLAFGLAVGEESFQFEHRDLHWGNVLISPTDEKWATFVLRGRLYRRRLSGVRGTVIDYSLSRVSLPLAGAERAALYNDLAHDDSLFDVSGDYQFEVYRRMRDKLGNEWKNFEPYTNILWLHYIVDKMITALRYKRTNTKIHKHYIAKLKGIKNRILDYGSAAQFVLTDNEI